jgi:predicted XRE-type DNA-binding protein
MSKHMNKQGLELIQYKKELKKNHSDIVKKSLLIAIEKLFELKYIDLQTLNMLKDDDRSEDDLVEYLLNKPYYIKTNEQISQELELFNDKLKESMEKHHILSELTTEIDVPKESVSVLKTFSVGEQFVCEYFGVHSGDVSDLMKKKGFVEKFSALKLTQVLKKIIEKIDEENISKDSRVYIHPSNVYHNKQNDTYNIDLTFELNVNDYYENISDIEKIAEKIKEIKEMSEILYEKYLFLK